MFDRVGGVGLGLDATQREVNEVLVPRVVEVAQKVTLDTVVPVVHSPPHRALTRGREVGLHGGGARVEHADCVGVAGPLSAEGVLEVVGQPLEGRSGTFCDDTDLVEPCEYELSCDD